MLQITLDIENNENEQLVVSLLKRRGIHYLALKKEVTNNANLDYHHKIIEQGIDNPDFDNFIEDFNQSRNDRIQPFETQ